MYTIQRGDKMYMSLLLLDCFARVGWAHWGRENGAMAHQTLTARFKVVMQMLKKETMQILFGLLQLQLLQELNVC